MDKPFKTYNQQMKYLRETKNIECSGSQHKSILITCGYFNLINGYKTLLFTAGNERARKKHDVRISLLILHRVVSFLQL